MLLRPPTSVCTEPNRVRERSASPTRLVPRSLEYTTMLRTILRVLVLVFLFFLYPKPKITVPWTRIQRRDETSAPIPRESGARDECFDRSRSPPTREPGYGSRARTELKITEPILRVGVKAVYTVCFHHGSDYISLQCTTSFCVE